VADLAALRETDAQRAAVATAEQNARRETENRLAAQRQARQQLAAARIPGGRVIAEENSSVRDPAVLAAERASRQRGAVAREPLLNLGIEGRNARDLVAARADAEQVLQELVGRQETVADEREFYQRLADRERTRARAAQDRQDALDLGDQIVDRLQTEQRLEQEADTLLSGLQNAQEALTAFRRLEQGLQQAAAPGLRIQQQRQLEQRNERFAQALNDFNADLGITQREERAAADRDARISTALDGFNQDFGQTLTENRQAEQRTAERRTAERNTRLTNAFDGFNQDFGQNLRDDALNRSFEDQAATDRVLAGIGDSVLTGQEANDLTSESLAVSRTPVEEVLDLNNPQEAEIAEAIVADRRRAEIANASRPQRRRTRRRSTRVTPEASTDTQDVRTSGQVSIDSSGGVSSVDSGNSATSGSVDIATPLPANPPTEPLAYIDYAKRKIAENGATNIARLIGPLVSGERLKGRSDLEIAQHVSDLLGQTHDAVFRAATPAPTTPEPAPAASTPAPTTPEPAPAASAARTDPEPESETPTAPATNESEPPARPQAADTRIPDPGTLIAPGDSDPEDFFQLNSDASVPVTSAEVNQVNSGIRVIANGAEPITNTIGVRSNREGVLPNYTEKPKTRDTQSNTAATRNFAQTVTDAQEYLHQSGIVDRWERVLPNGGTKTVFLPSDLSTSRAFSTLERLYSSTLTNRNSNEPLLRNGESVDVTQLLGLQADSDSVQSSESSQPGEALPPQGGVPAQDQLQESLTADKPTPADIDRTAEPAVARVKFTRSKLALNPSYWFATRAGNEYEVETLEGSGNVDLGIPADYTVRNLTTDTEIASRLPLRDVRELAAEIAHGEGGQVKLPKNGLANQRRNGGQVNPHRDALMPTQGDAPRTETEKRQQLVDVQKQVKRMAGRLRGAPVQVFDGIDGLTQPVIDLFQEQLGVPFDNRVRAFVFDNVVYVNSEAIGSPEALEESLAHEILGHRGLRARYGVSLNKELDRIANILGGVSGIVQYASESGIDLSGYESLIDRARTAPDMLARAAERDLVEELVALSVGNTIEPRILSQLKLAGAKIRKWLSFIAPRFSQWAGYGMSDVDMMVYAAKAASAPVTEDGQKRLQPLSDNQYLHAYRKSDSVLFEERNTLADNARRAQSAAATQARALLTGERTDTINDQFQRTKQAAIDYAASMGYADKGQSHRDVINAPETSFNKIVRNMVDDLRVLSVASTEWARRAAQRQFRKVFDQSEVLSDDANFVSTSGDETAAAQANKALVDYFKSKYATAGAFRHFAQRAVGLRDIHRSVVPRSRVRLQREIAAIDVELNGALDALSRGWSVGGGVLDKALTTEKVNEWLRVNHTLEAIPQLFRDADSGLVAGALSAMRGSRSGATNQRAKDIKKLFSTDPVAASQELSDFVMGELSASVNGQSHDEAVTDFMSNKRPTGLTWFEAFDRYRQLTEGPNKLSPNQIDLLDAVNDQLQRKINRAEQQYSEDSVSNIAQRGEFRGRYHFFPVKKLGETDLKGFGSNDGLLADVADIIAPANDRESPIHSINRHIEKAFTNHEYGELRDALTLGVMTNASGVSELHKKLTDNVFDGSFIEFIRNDGGATSEERGSYAQALKESRKRDGATMLLSIPTPADQIDTLGPTLTYAVRFQNTLPEGRNLLALNKSQRTELDQSIKDSDNVLLNVSARGAGFMSGMMTRFSLAHAPVSLIRDTALGLFSVMANYDNSGRFVDDAPVAARAWSNSVTSSLQNAKHMTKYMHHRSRLGTDPKAEARIAALSKLNPTMQRFHEFIESGGLITQLQEITDGNNGARQKITDRILSVTGADKRDQTVEVIGALVSMADVIGRFSTYEAEIALGRTPEQARDRSLNIADFGQRGESRAADLGAMLYMFFRSGGVGATQTIDSAFNTPYGKEMGALGIAAGASLVALGALLSPDDENGDNLFLTRQQGTSSFTLYNPITEAPTNVPVPYGHVGMMAHMTFMLMHGLAGGEDNIASLANNMSTVFQRQLSPINTDIPLYDDSTGEFRMFESALDAVVPSVLRPMYRIMTNTNGFGNPITSENDNPYNTSPGDVGGAAELVSRALGLDARLTAEIMGSTIPAVEDAGNFLIEASNLAIGNTDFDTVDYKRLLYPFNRLVGRPAQSRAQRDYYRGLQRLEDLQERVRVRAGQLGLNSRDDEQRQLAINHLNLSLADRLLLEDYGTFVSGVRSATEPKRRAQRLDTPLLTDDGSVGSRRAAIDAADEQAAQVMQAARQYLNRLDATF
jgi:hypothetical protein